jgi:hypothetical protein
MMIVNSNQPDFDPKHIPFRTFKTLDEHVRKAMLPGSNVKTVNLHEELDGNQPIKFVHVSILDEIKHMLGNPAYSGKMYTKHEYEKGGDAMYCIQLVFVAY